MCTDVSHALIPEALSFPAIMFAARNEIWEIDDHNGKCALKTPSRFDVGQRSVNELGLSEKRRNSWCELPSHREFYLLSLAYGHSADDMMATLPAPISKNHSSNRALMHALQSFLARDLQSNHGCGVLF
jgi:hypothetical protein